MTSLVQALNERQRGIELRDSICDRDRIGFLGLEKTGADEAEADED
jgi:hypothetical protein